MKKGIWMKTILIALSMMAVSYISAGASAESDLSYPVITETDCVWDQNGNLISETAHTLNGAPAMNSRGFHEAIYQWDEHGNLLLEKYTDLDGNPVDIDKGYAWAEYTYHILEVKGKPESYILTEDRYAADGSRANISGEYSYRRDLWDHDQIVYTKYFDSNDTLTRPNGGYAQILYDVNKTDQEIIITKRYLDADGSPLTGTEGGEVVVSVYSPKLYLTKEYTNEYLNWDMLHPEEIQKDDTAYEPFLISQTILKANGEKILGSDRWHRQENDYDEKGNLLRTDYYDADDELLLCTEGYASVTHVYDQLNRVIETAYWDIDGNLIKTLTGYARVTFEYYSQSDRIHFERYYGADNQRTMTTYGYSMAEYEYDGDGFDWRVTYYDTIDELEL